MLRLVPSASSWPSSIGLQLRGVSASRVRGSKFQRANRMRRVRQGSLCCGLLRKCTGFFLTEGRVWSRELSARQLSWFETLWSTRFPPSLDARRTWMHFRGESTLFGGSSGCGARSGTKCRLFSRVWVIFLVVVVAGVNFKNNQNFNDFVLLHFFGFYFNVLLFLLVLV